MLEFGIKIGTIQELILHETTDLTDSRPNSFFLLIGFVLVVSSWVSAVY